MENILLEDAYKALSDNFAAMEGEGDFFDFKGAVSMLDGKNSDKRFSVTLQNTCTSAKTVALTAAAVKTERVVIPDASSSNACVMIGGTNLNKSDALPEVVKDNPANLAKAGVSCDAVFCDGIDNVIYKDATGQIVVSSEDGQEPSFIRGYIEQGNSLHINRVAITSDKEAQFAQKFKIDEISPLQDKGSRNINFDDYHYTDQNLTNKINVTKDFVLTPKDALTVTIPAATKTTFIFVVSTEASVANKMKKETTNYRKKVAAKENAIDLQRVGIRKKNAV